MHQILLDLFKRFVFGFRQFETDENETQHANHRVKEEGSRRAELRVQHRKRERQQKTREPQGRNRDGHRRAANPVRKNFRDDHPRHRRERHRVAADGRQHEQQHRQALRVPGIAARQRRENNRQPGRAKQHQRTTPKTIHRAERNKRERHVNRAGPRDVFQDAGNVVAGGLENFLGIIKNDIDAAPLLEHRQPDAEQQNLFHLRRQQFAEIHLFGFVDERGFNFSKRGAGIVFTTDFLQNGFCVFGFSFFRQPARAFGNQKHAEKKQQRRRGRQRQHNAQE